MQLIQDAGDLRRIDQPVEPLGNPQAGGRQFLYRKILQCADQLIHCRGDARDLRVSPITSAVDHFGPRIETKIDAQLPGDDALQVQTRPQPLIDQFLQRLLLILRDEAVAPEYFVPIHIDHHRHDKVVVLRIKSDLNTGDLPDADPLQNHRRTHLQAGRIALKIDVEAVPVAAVFARPEIDYRGDQNSQRGEYENADQRRICPFTHIISCPLPLSTEDALIRFYTLSLTRERGLFARLFHG